MILDIFFRLSSLLNRISVILSESEVSPQLRYSEPYNILGLKNIKSDTTIT